MLGSLIRVPILPLIIPRSIKRFNSTSQFETVFSLPSIKYIALLNRLKVYHLCGTSVIVPSCGALEIANIMSESTFFTASYIGLTGLAVLSLASLPLKNIIGFIYISEDNSSIKISSVDFWGNRKDRIIGVDEWIPLFDMEPKKMDAVFLTPQLSDGTKYKLLIRYGNVLNSRKFGEILE